MEFQGPLYKFCRWLMRIIQGRFSVPASEDFIQPAVYICRHHNIKGPYLSMLHLPIAVHLWVLHVFLDKRQCYRHLVGYTFTKRYGWSKPRAAFLAWLASGAFSRLARSTGGIPVYRNSLRLRTTLAESADALARGENVLLFPDIDYTNTAADTGSLYEGFLMVDHFYQKKTGGHVPFVPLHVSESRKLLAIGEPVRIGDERTYKEESEAAIEALHERWNQLSAMYGE